MIGRVVSGARWIARAIGLLLLVVAMIVGSLVVHLQTAVVRRVVAAVVNQQVFDPLFRGTFTILTLGHVDLGGVSGVRVRVLDPAGQQVLEADEVHARIATLTLLRTLVFGHGDLVLDISDVQIDHVDIRLDRDAAGVALANAFGPRTPSTGGGGLRVHLYAPHIRVHHAWGHGLMTNLPYFDGEVTDLDAAFVLEPTRLLVEARRGHVLARGIALGANAEGAFHGDLALGLGVPLLEGRFGWDGTAGTLRETLSAGVEKGRFDASVDVPDAAPEDVRSLWPGSPILGATTAHVEAHGALESIVVSLHAGVDAATANVDGVVGWGATKTAKVRVDVVGVDLHQLGAPVHASSLSLTGDVAASLSESGRLDGEAALDLASGHVDEHHVPHTTLKTNGFRERSGAFGGDATVMIEEPGAPTTVILHAVPTRESSSVDFSIASHDVRLGAIRRFSTDARGNVHILGKGNIDLERLKVDVTLDSRGDSLTQGKLRVGGLTIQGRARGHLLNPDVDLAVHARDVAWDAAHVATLDVTVRGTAMSPHVTLRERSVDAARLPTSGEHLTLPDLDAAADIDILDGPTVRHATVHVARRADAADIAIESARFTHGDIGIAGLTVTGLGSPMTASAQLAGGTTHVHVHAPKLELDRVARLAGFEDVVRGGVALLDADVSIRGGTASGRATVKMEHGSISALGDISAHFDGEIKNRRFAGVAGLRVATIGSLELDAKQLVVGGVGPFASASWRSVWGDVTLDGHVDLGALAAHIPVARLPFSTIQGQLDLKGRFERDSGADVTPLVQLQSNTAGVHIRGKAPPSSTKDEPATPPWAIDGVDATTVVRVNGDTGAVDLSVELRDASGELAKLEASSKDIPYKAIFAAPAAALATLPSIGFDARATIPRRATDAFPKVLGHLPVDGELEVEAHVNGPLNQPRAEITAKLLSVKSAVARLSTPIDLDLHATYNAGRADAELHASQEGRNVLASEAHATVQASDLLAGVANLPWRASGKVHLEEFPLVTVGPLDDRQVRGRMSGDVQLDDLHGDAKAHVALSVASLKIGDATYPTAKATFDADGKAMTLDVRLDESDGFGSVKASVPASWGAALWPRPDPQKSLELTVQAKHFRAAAVLPFLRGSIDELDGLVDANLTATIDPTTQRLRANGSVEVKEGVFQLATFGGELHGIAAKATITPAGLLTLERLTAFGVSGELMAAATARMDGLRLGAASATVVIPKSSALPISVGGSLLGTVDGKINISESSDAAHPHLLNVKVDIPTLHLLVPDTSSQDVQTLGTLRGVKVGTRSGPTGEFVVLAANPEEEAEMPGAARPEDAVQIRVVTTLGDDVSIRKGTDVRVELLGGPTLMITDKVRASGQIRLHGGVLNLYGKKFEIEQGTVTFVGEKISNPQVAVTAAWTAGDGTQVLADFIGPLKTGKVTLRSEPSLPNNEIVELLLFGSVEGQAASTGGVPGTSSAEGVAGNVATQPLNHALSQFGLSAVSAKVDTSSVNAKPEVEVQIAKDISVAVAQIIGQPPVGTNPDTSFLTIDWRFLRKWSLAATVGNADTTIVDLLWRYRY